MRRSVITYFEPFGGRETNASKEVVLGMEVGYEVIGLPVSWKKSLEIVNSFMKDKPRYVFLVGEAGKYNDVTVEVCARNICSGVDEDGDKRDNDKIAKNTPKELRTNFDIDKLDFVKSDNAGKFLCNYVYYQCLLKAEITKVIFIHVPYLEELGSNRKDAVIRKVENIIYTILDNEDSFLLKLGDRTISINEDNAYGLFEKIRVEYCLPNIIIGVEEQEDGLYMMSGRADGYKGVWYEYDDDLVKMRKSIYFKIIHFQVDMSLDDREESSVFHHKTRRYDINEYFGSEKLLRRYLNLFISRADYTDEFMFYKSLDRIYENLLKSVVDGEEENAINSAKEYISRLGYPKTKELLFKLVKR